MRDYAVALWGAWRPTDTADSLVVAGHEMVVVTGQTVGCVSSERRPEALLITKLYLAEGARNRGIGAGLLRQKIDLAASLNLPVRLRVLTTNPDALRFYLRMGFKVLMRDAERVFVEYQTGSNA